MNKHWLVADLVEEVGLHSGLLRAALCKVKLEDANGLKIWRSRTAFLSPERARISPTMPIVPQRTAPDQGLNPSLPAIAPGLSTNLCVATLHGGAGVEAKSMSATHRIIVGSTLQKVPGVGFATISFKRLYPCFDKEALVWETG